MDRSLLSTGSISDNTFTATHLPGEFIGTYAINGGCAGGDKGNVTGVIVSSLAGNWAGDLTSETGDTNRLTVTLAQGAANSEGIFGLSGTAFFEVGTCFKSAKITSGTFPSGSYTVGRDVSLEIETDNGVIVFVGTSGRWFDSRELHARWQQLRTYRHGIPVAVGILKSWRLFASLTKPADG